MSRTCVKRTRHWHYIDWALLLRVCRIVYANMRAYSKRLVFFYKSTTPTNSTSTKWTLDCCFNRFRKDKKKMLESISFLAKRPLRRRKYKILHAVLDSVTNIYERMTELVHWRIIKSQKLIKGKKYRHFCRATYSISWKRKRRT